VSVQEVTVPYRSPLPYRRLPLVWLFLLAALAVAPAAAQLVSAGGPFPLLAEPVDERPVAPARVAALGDGTFLALWQLGTLDDFRIRGRRFGAGGTLGEEIGFGDGLLDDVAVAPGGGLLLVVDGAVRRVGLDGTALAAPVYFDDGRVEPGVERCTWVGFGEQTRTAVAPAADGGFAVAWSVCLRFPELDPPEDEWHALRFRRFDGAGAPLGPSAELALAYRIWTPAWRRTTPAAGCSPRPSSACRRWSGIPACASPSTSTARRMPSSSPTACRTSAVPAPPAVAASPSTRRAATVG
jgi:hypothetical protein